MNYRQKKLLDRLSVALDIISEGIETEAMMNELLEDLVISGENIAADLMETSDKETASTLRSLISNASMPDSGDDTLDSDTLFLLSDFPRV